MVLGREHLHPAVVHLAVAAAVFACIADALALRGRSDCSGEWRRFAGRLYAAATALAAVALATGHVGAAAWSAKGELLPDSVLRRHLASGYALAGTVLALALWHRFQPEPKAAAARYLRVVLGLAATAAAGHSVVQGLVLTYFYGVNVDLP